MNKITVYRRREHLNREWQEWKYSANIVLTKSPDRTRYGNLKEYKRLDSLAKRIALNLGLEGVDDFEVSDPEFYFEPRIKQKTITVARGRRISQMDHLIPDDMKKLKQKVKDYLQRQRIRN